MPWKESFPRVALRFDEFPTNVSATRSLSGPRACTLIGFETQYDCQSLIVRDPFRDPDRKDSAACVSLSSNYNVKEPWGVRRSLTPEPPMETNPPSGVNDSRGESRKSFEPAPPLSDWIARSPSPAGAGSDPRVRGYLCFALPNVKAVRGQGPRFFPEVS